MTLIKTSVLSFIATAIKMIAALVINKAVAIYIGPTGLALVGQFQNFSQLMLTAAQGAINSGVTKYTAEYGKEDKRTVLLFSTASKISLCTSVFVGCCLIVFSKFASFHFLQTEEYSYIFIVFGFTIVLFVINNLLLAILNGLKEIKTWIVINITQSLYSLIFTTVLIFFFGLEGALLALVTNQSIVFIVVLWLLRNHPILKLKNFTFTFNKKEGKRLANFAMMTITSAIAAPVSNLVIRNHIGESLGWDNAGYWQAIWYISLMYLSVITTALGIYYLPKLSELKDKNLLRVEIWNGYKLLVPLVSTIAIIIYLSKDIIIWLLFSESFEPMRELFLWQLIGDVLKMCSWLIAYIMLAKAMKTAFIGTEIVFSITLVLLSVIFINKFGLVGVTYAYATNYFFYFITIYLVTRKQWTS